MYVLDEADVIVDVTVATEADSPTPRREVAVDVAVVVVPVALERTLAAAED